ncbi:MAG: biotin--[acetyl-CoA-carboxylase] ligase [Brevinematales bacterium]|nr:biotin--[acetyl-CoA-carboxylase] ligase [Brevinematales bacterium]
MDKILLYLLEKGDFVSGEEISEKFSISRTAVWKHINIAREQGIEIESITGKGYRLKKIPENRIIPEVIYSDIKNIPIEIVYLEEIQSTNDYAKLNIDKFKDKDFLVVTDNQTRGRGRFNREWKSEKGLDLTFSLVIHPDLEIKFFYNFTIIAVLSVFNALKPILDDDKHLKIKWPNDIYYGEKKICGILSEMISEETRLKSLIIGIGINVNSFPRLETAISLKQLTNNALDRHILLTSLLKNFYQYYKIHNEKFNIIFSEWKKNLKNLGEKINFKYGERTISGEFIDVEVDGSIKIKTEEGILTFYSGEFL